MKISDYAFNVGDEVITVDGIRGRIINVCHCERCAKRGFFEPVWEDELGDEHYITDYEAGHGFNNYYKIGERYFNKFDKFYIEQHVALCEKTLVKLRKQLQVIEEFEAKEK